MSDTGPFPAVADDDGEPHPPELVTGKMISLRFLASALRRRRRFWVGLAVVGLLVGGGYHVAVPKTYSATTTLYLAHPSGSDDSVIAANDLALVRTVDVGRRAIALLDEPGLTPFGLLGAAPAKEASSNILVLTISGSTRKEALRRVDAVTQAYLAFRSAQYDAQNQAIVSATNRQIGKFQTEVNRLTTEINGTPSSGTGQLTGLIGQRSNLQSQITNLQQTVQADNLATASLSQGSRVITDGTLVATSEKKEIAIDAVSGLIGGLAVGLILVIMQAVLSDRLWRREDIAGVLRAPVELSIARPDLWRRRPFSIARQAAHPTPELQNLVHFLHDRLTKAGSRRVGMVVAVDDVRPAAAAVAALASRLRSSGREVVVVDATLERALGRAFRMAGPDVGQVQVGDGSEITLVAPPKPWEADDDDDWWERMQDEWANADTVLVVASIAPAYGAGYLSRWASEAVVTVTADRCTAQRINVVAELLDAAGVLASSAVLLGADASDESIGFPDPQAYRSARRPDAVSGAQRALAARDPW